MSYKITIPTELAEIKLKDLLAFSALDPNNERQIMYKAFDLFFNINKSDVNLIPLEVADKALTRLNEVFPSHDREPLQYRSNRLLRTQFDMAAVIQNDF